MLAFGTVLPLDPGPASYNFWPLLFVPLAVVTMRFVIGWRVNAIALVAAFLAGTVLGWSVESIGIVQPVTVSILLAALASLWRRRPQRA